MVSVVQETYIDTDAVCTVSPKVSAFVQEYISLFGNSETNEVYFENKNIKAIDALIEKHFEIKIDLDWKFSRQKNMQKLFETCSLMLEGLWGGVYCNDGSMKVMGVVENGGIKRIIKKRLQCLMSRSEFEYSQIEKRKKEVKEEVKQVPKEIVTPEEELDGRDFFSKVQKWFESNVNPYVHDFGNTVISGNKCRNAINYMASFHESYRIQDRVHGNVLIVVKCK